MTTKMISATIPVKQIKWLNKQAKDLGISRNQLLVMIFNGMMVGEKEGQTSDTLFALYQSHIEQLLEAAHRKQNKRA